MPIYEGETLTVVMNKLIGSIQRHGTHVTTRGRTSRELVGIVLKIQDPLGRIYMQEPPIDLVRIIGRVLWDMQESVEVESIAYYDHNAHWFANEDGIVHAAYGARLMPQIRKIIDLLKNDPGSRRAIAQVLYTGIHDEYLTKLEFPCLIGMQFFIRHGKLDCVAFMRSQNVVKLLPQDIFLTTMIQEYVAEMLSAKLGMYTHMIGSAHIFDGDECTPLRGAPYIMNTMWNGIPDIAPNVLLECMGLYEHVIRKGLSVADMSATGFILNNPTSTAAQLMILLMSKSAVAHNTTIYDGYLKNLSPFYQQFIYKETT